jgi:hypothetical protein
MASYAKLYASLTKRRRCNVNCPKCGQVRPASQFALRPNLAEGRDWYCQPCRQQMHAERLAREVAQIAKRRQERIAKSRRKHKQVLAKPEPEQRPVIPCRVLMRDGVWLVPEQQRPGKYKAQR